MGSPVSNSSWKPSHGRGEEVEKLALETFTDTPIWWKRFVDAEQSPESFFNKSALRLFRGSWNSKIWPKLCLFVVFHISTWEVGTLFGDAKPNRGGETVDDTFVIMEKSKLSELFVFLGGLSLGVFLDLLIKHSSNRPLLSAVYLKPTNSDRNLSFRSRHPLQHQQSVVNTLFKRTKKLFSPVQNLNIEMKYRKRTLMLNIYPK